MSEFLLFAGMTASAVIAGFINHRTNKYKSPVSKKLDLILDLVIKIDNKTNH